MNAFEKFEKIARRRGLSVTFDFEVEGDCLADVIDVDGDDLLCGRGPNMESATVDALSQLGEL